MRTIATGPPTELVTTHQGSGHRAWPSCGRRLERVALVCLLCLLVSCARCDPEPNKSTLKWGGALTVTGGSRLGVNVLVDNFVGEALLGIDWTGRVEPRLAVSWQWSPDHLRLELTIRSGVRFHDGTLADASIVASLLQKRIDLREASSYADVARVEVVDSDTIVHPTEETERIPARGPCRIHNQRQGLAGACDGPVSDCHRETPPSNWLPSTSTIKAVRRSTRLEIKPYDTLRGAWAAMMRGDIDVLQDVGRDTVEFVEAESSVQVYRFLRAYYYPLVFNVRNPILKSKEVRQALSQAVDRQTIVAKAMHGPRARGRRPDLAIPLGAFRSAAQIHVQPGGCAAATRSRGAYREPRSPSRGACRAVCASRACSSRTNRRSIASPCICSSSSPRSAWTCRSSLSRSASSRAGSSTGNFDAFVMEMVSARSLTWTYTFWHSNGHFLHSGYDAADGPLDRLRVANSDDETRTAVAELQQVLYDDPPAIFIAWPEAARAVRGHLRGALRLQS